MSQNKLETRILNMEDVKSILTMKEAIQVVENAFKGHIQRKTQMLPRTYLFLQKHSGRIGFMPSYIESVNAAGIKIVSAFHENPEKYNLPVILATIILNDTKTGQTRAIMDGTYITMVRTGAIGAIAAKYLSRKDSNVAGIIGAGVQGRGQLLALSEVRKIDKALVFSRTSSSRRNYAEEMSQQLGIDITPVDSAEKVVKNADILVTATTSPTPVIAGEWVEPGLHITTVGVSTAGKQEIPTEVFKKSKLVVDEVDQTSKIGGISVPFSGGAIRKEDIHAEIGEIILGKKPGRISNEEITVFVSSGLAIQDIATAELVYQKAMTQDIGEVIRFPF